MSEEKETPTRYSWPRTFENLFDWMGCIAIILIFGTCAGCFSVAGIVVPK